MIEQLSRRTVWLFVCLGVLCASLPGMAQGPAKSQPTPANPQPSKSSQALPTGVTPPAGYVIGLDDALAIRFWGDTQMSADVVVRPDGKVSVPLLNDVQAAGLTPEQLNQALEKAASKFIAEPDATVIVREIRSRKVFVLGQVAKQGPVSLNREMNVLQVLAEAGGLLEYANKEDIVIIRTENGQQRRMKFNFNDVVKGKNVQQNIQLLPGDTVLVN
jgi:polysaccharide export outer membrane protein